MRIYADTINRLVGLDNNTGRSKMCACGVKNNDMIYFRLAIFEKLCGSKIKSSAFFTCHSVAMATKMATDKRCFIYALFFMLINDCFLLQARLGLHPVLSRINVAFYFWYF